MQSQSQPLCLFYTPPSEGISLALRAIIIIHLISPNNYASSDIFVAVFLRFVRRDKKSRSKHEKHHILRTRQQVPNGCSCMNSSNLNIWWFYASRGAPQFTIITPLQRFPCFWPPRDWFIRLIFVSTQWRERDVKKLKMFSNPIMILPAPRPPIHPPGNNCCNLTQRGGFLNPPHCITSGRPFWHFAGDNLLTWKPSNLTPLCRQHVASALGAITIWQVEAQLGAITIWQVEAQCQDIQACRSQLHARCYRFEVIWSNCQL